MQQFIARAKLFVVIRLDRAGPCEWQAKREIQLGIKDPGLEHVIDKQR
jgi:hypothetical protein